MGTGQDTEGTGHWLRRGLLALAAGLGALIVILLVLAVIPAGTGGLGAATPDPAAGYAQSLARFRATTAAEGEVKPICRSRLLSDGAPTERVIVLFHGLSNCPRQMVELAEKLHADGANVLILRAPDHGLPGDMGRIADVRAQDYRRYASSTVDMADGFGRQVTLVGLSLGGMLTAWAAQERPDVYRAVMVAPAMKLGSVPGFVSEAFTNVFTRLPNKTIPGAETPPHQNRGTATRPTAEMFRLSRRVLDDAGTTPPPTTRLAVVVNENDGTVSNDAIDELVADWRAHGRRVREVRLPASLGLPHDVIDVTQPAANTSLVYPIVAALAEGRPLPPGTP